MASIPTVIRSWSNWWSSMVPFEPPRREDSFAPGLYGRTFVHLSTSVHIFIFLMVRRLNPSMRWTACLRPPSTSVHLGQIIMVCRPNSSMRWTVRLRPAVHLRPSMENFHGLSSEFVHSSISKLLSRSVVRICP